MTKTPRYILGMLIIGLLPMTFPGIAKAGPDAQVFVEAPEPQKLADILFPPRYRGFGRDVAKAQPDMFGMMVNFEFDSDVILSESKPLLDAVAEMMRLQKVAGRGIVIEGHTDAIGTHAYNKNLSERRASAIRNYLINTAGVSPKRLVLVGKGEVDLHDKQNPQASVNRRAVFRPVKKLVLK